MAKEMVGGVSGSVLGMLADLNLKLKNGSISPGELERFVQRKNPFEQVSDLIASWQKFYREVMAVVNFDFSTVRIPTRRLGFDRLVVVLSGMTPELLFQACKNHFGAWKWTTQDLDGIVVSERIVVTGAYGVWFRDRVEADEELKGRSCNDLKDAGVTGITLEERLLDELEYHFRTGKHKDINNATLCAGSRYSDGHVPSVHWDGRFDELDVRRCFPGPRFDNLRCREAVS